MCGKKFGVNKFGLNPTVTPIHKIRCDVGSHVPCAIARKIILCFRRHIERYDNNEPVCLCFDEMWGNTCYSN